jgi:hypothetical protein
VIIVFIKWSHREIADCKPCTVVLDIHPSHRTELMIAAAEESNIEFLCDPGGWNRQIPADGPPNIRRT